MSKKIAFISSVSVLALAALIVPEFVHAQPTLYGLIAKFETLLRWAYRIIWLLILAAAAYNAFNLVRADSDDKRKEAKKALIATIVALFVLTALMPIVSLLRDATDTGSGNDDIGNDDVTQVIFN